MTEVTVRTQTVELRATKLTKSILKQMPCLDYDQMKPLLKADGNEKPECVVGWVHGSVFGEDHETWLIFKIGEGLYGRYSMMQHARKKYPQIYIV
jgi:hypothetical protein